MKKYDVVALGELLVDFTSSGSSQQGNTLFEANPGGAPCNVLAMLKQLGHETAFVGKVGDDIFGRRLKKTLEELSIGTDGLCVDKEVRTTLAFVENDASGDRSFSFYRSPGADMMLREDEVNEALIKEAQIFHFGTLSMTHEGVRNATKKALKLAKENDICISFDPNLRESLWSSLKDAWVQMDYGLRYCDILKISDNEIQWFTGEDDFDKGIECLQTNYKIPLILLSMGKEGSRAYCGDICVEVPAFLQENTVETTGAGDTFFGCCLHYLLKAGVEKVRRTPPKAGCCGVDKKILWKPAFQESFLQEMLTFANGAASIITTRKGALKVMPTQKEVEDFAGIREA